MRRALLCRRTGVFSNMVRIVRIGHFPLAQWRGKECYTYISADMKGSQICTGTARLVLHPEHVDAGWREIQGNGRFSSLPHIKHQPPYRTTWVCASDFSGANLSSPFKDAQASNGGYGSA